MSTIIIEIPEKFVKDIKLNNRTLKDALKRGLLQIKIDNILKKYQRGEMSLGYAAKVIGVSKQEMIRQAYARGINPSLSEDTFREEIGK